MQVVAKTQAGDTRNYWPGLSRDCQYPAPVPARVITDDGSEFHSPFGGPADMGASGEASGSTARGSTELVPALPSRSLRTALFFGCKSGKDLNKWNRSRGCAGNPEVPLKELEAPAAGIAGEWAEKTGFVARVKTPALDSTSSSSWDTSCLPEVQFFIDGDVYPAHTGSL